MMIEQEKRNEYSTGVDKENESIWSNWRKDEEEANKEGLFLHPPFIKEKSIVGYFEYFKNLTTNKDKNE